MKSDGTKDISQDATQNTSWFPIGMAEGADNLPRVLYKGKYQSMVTVHTNDGSYSSQGASSILTDWVPQAIAVGNDNVGRLAFRYEADERWALWECNANCSGPASQSYDWGPWDDGAGHKWNLLSISMTNSGSYPFKTLWTLNGTDKMSNIHFSSDGSTLGAYNSTYGPYTDWVPVGIGGGSDDYARILWDDVSANSCTLWRMDTSANKYGSNFDYQRW